MANTKVTMLNTLATTLQGLSAINKATRNLLPPDQARAAAPYVGILSASETVMTDDGTDVRWLLDSDLILLRSGDAIEEMVDTVKNAMLDGMAATIGAKEIRLVGTEEIALLNADDYSSTRMAFEVVYVSTKGAA